VTYARPLHLGYLYLSLVDLTTRAADGQATEAGVVGAVWREFQGLDLHRRDLDPVTGAIDTHPAGGADSLLQYWTPWTLLDGLDPGATGYYGRCANDFGPTLYILTNLVSRCGSWAQFFVDTLAVQGIAAADRSVDFHHPVEQPGQLSAFLAEIDAPAGTASVGEDQLLMLIADWSFGEPSGGGAFPYLSAVNETVGGRAGHSNGWALGDVHAVDDDPGVAGQGEAVNPNPPGWFGIGDHAIVVYHGQIYDPSYGTGPFASIREWAQASLAGFAYVTPATGPGGAKRWLIHANRLATHEHIHLVDGCRTPRRGELVRVSVGVDGKPVIGNFSDEASISRDGRAVAFGSGALIPLTDDQMQHGMVDARGVYVCTLATGSLTRAAFLNPDDPTSPNPAGYGPFVDQLALADSGAKVGFDLDGAGTFLVNAAGGGWSKVSSQALIAMAPSAGSADPRFFVLADDPLVKRFLGTGAYWRASIGLEGATRRVVFWSQAHVAPDVPADPEGGGAIYLAQGPADAETYSLVSSRPNAAEVANDAVISADGSTIAWSETGPRNARHPRTEVYVLDLRHHRRLIASSSASGLPGNNGSSAPELSADGRFVAFESDATNLIGGPRRCRLLIKDLVTGGIKALPIYSCLVSQLIHNAYSLSADGHWVAFKAPRYQVDTHTANSGIDIYVERS
jgi:hypothetical protein